MPVVSATSIGSPCWTSTAFKTPSWSKLRMQWMPTTSPPASIVLQVIQDFMPAGLFSSEGPACVLMFNGTISTDPMLASELVVIDGTMREALAHALRTALSSEPW